MKAQGVGAVTHDSSTDDRVIIAGGGIGGLAAALTLHQASSVPAMTSGGCGAWGSRDMREAKPKPVNHTWPVETSMSRLAGLMSLCISPC